MNRLHLACLLVASTLNASTLKGARPELVTPPDLASNALDEKPLADAGDGRLEGLSLFRAALVASGVSGPAQLAMYEVRWRSVCEGLASAIPAHGDVGVRAAAVLRWMHEHVLTGDYQAACTTLDRTLETGDYNCVTATIVYRCLCAELGIPVTPMAEPGHVYCRLAVEPPVEIQTTSAHAFAAGSNRPGREGLRAGGTSAKRLNGGRVISDSGLVARIYYNRGVAALERTQYERAFMLLEASHRWDPSNETAWHNLLACINNWALSESDAGRFAQAVALLGYGLQVAPDYEPFRDNDLHVHHRWVTELCRKGRFQRALEILDSAHRRRPDAALFDQGRLAVFMAWKNALVAAGRVEEAAAVLDIAKHRFPKYARDWQPAPASGG